MGGKIIQGNTPEQNRFVSISDFKWCIHDGGEVQFIYHAKIYGIIHHHGKIIISQLYNEETEKAYDTVDELLKYNVDGDPLYNVITKVTVIDRTI